MPKIMSCNSVSIEDWLRQIANYLAEEDANAVMRRSLFVEVDRQLIPEACRRAYVKTSQAELCASQAAFLREQGIDVGAPVEFAPIARQL